MEQRLRKAKKNLFYKGFGFVEAVIAIIVVGIVCVVFLRILISSVKSVREMEAYDHLTRMAYDTVENVQILALKQDTLTSIDPRVFPTVNALMMQNTCYRIVMNSGSPSFAMTSPNVFETCELSGQAPYLDCPLSVTDNEYSIVCVKSVDINSKSVVIEVMVGYTNCDPSDENKKQCSYTMDALIRQK